MIRSSNIITVKRFGIVVAAALSVCQALHLRSAGGQPSGIVTPPRATSASEPARNANGQPIVSALRPPRPRRNGNNNQAASERNNYAGRSENYASASESSSPTASANSKSAASVTFPNLPLLEVRASEFRKPGPMHTPPPHRFYGHRNSAGHQGRTAAGTAFVEGARAPPFVIKNDPQGSGKCIVAGRNFQEGDVVYRVPCTQKKFIKQAPDVYTVQLSDNYHVDFSSARPGTEMTQHSCSPYTYFLQTFFS